MTKDKLVNNQADEHNARIAELQHRVTLLEALIKETKSHDSAQRFLSKRISRLEQQFKQMEAAERLSLIGRIYKIKKSASLEAFTTEVEKIFADLESK